MNKIVTDLEQNFSEKFTFRIKSTSKTNICLYGPPGAGKTSVSKVLGKKLSMPVYDVDDDHLENDFKTTVSLKLKELGDDLFIQAEGGKILVSH